VQAVVISKFTRERMCQGSTNWMLPSIFGATFPSESLLNFNEVIPGGLYSSSSGSTDSLITKVAAYRQTKSINIKSCI